MLCVGVTAAGGDGLCAGHKESTAATPTACASCPDRLNCRIAWADALITLVSVPSSSHEHTCCPPGSARPGHPLGSRRVSPTSSTRRYKRRLLQHHLHWASLCPVTWWPCAFRQRRPSHPTRSPRPHRRPPQPCPPPRDQARVLKVSCNAPPLQAVSHSGPGQPPRPSSCDPTGRRRVEGAGCCAERGGDDGCCQYPLDDLGHCCLSVPWPVAVVATLLYAAYLGIR